MWLIYILAYLTIGYVTSVLYERRRRWKKRQCVVCEQIRTYNYHYFAPTCNELHANAQVLWVAIPGWPVFWAGRLLGLFLSFMQAISPAKAAVALDGTAEKVAAATEARRKRAEEIRKVQAEEAARKARGLVLVEGNDEVDS